MEILEDKSPASAIEDAPDQPLGGPKAGTTSDRKDMVRMGKVQELRRNFRTFPITAFAAVLMSTCSLDLQCILPRTS